MRLCWLLVVLAASLLSVWAFDQPVVLREKLGFTWTHELVSFPFSAKETTCHEDSITLTGPHGPVPVQLTGVIYWPGTPWVKTARIAFITDLAPLATDTYTLHYATAPGQVRAASDLQVETRANMLVLTTSKFGIQLLNGEKAYTPPAPASDVPGPVLGLRLADGAWVGSSCLYGTRKITGYTAKLEESGPVFGLATVRYTFDDGQSLEISVQLAAGEAQAQWSSYSSTDALQDGWQLRLTPGLDGLRLPLTGEFFNNKWNKLNEITQVELQKEPAGLITSLQPWHDWWDGQTQTEWTFETPARGKVLTMTSREPGDWVTPLAPGAQDGWERWGRKMIPLFREATGEVTLHINAAEGWRKWALGTPGTSIGHRLDIVKDYALDLASATKQLHPRLYLSRDDIAAYRATHPVDPKQIDTLVSLANQWKPDDHGNLYALPYAARAYLLTTSPEVATRVQFKERFFIILDKAVRQQGFDFMRSTTVLTNLYDILIDSGLLTPEEQRLASARMIYVGYIIADPNTWSVERGYCSANPNMSISFILNLGIVGCLFPEHPQATAWSAPAVARLKQMLTNDVGPVGEWVEGPHYTNVSLQAMLSFAIAARNAGFANYVDAVPLKLMALHNAKSYLPPDPRYSNQRTSPPTNTSGERWATPGMMAYALRKSDPALSAQLQWLWLAAGASTNIGNGAMLGFEDIILDRQLPAKAPSWGSEINRNFVKFNHGFNTPDEHFLFAPASSNGMIWGHEGGALNALYGYGKPLSVLFGLYYGTPMSRESLLQSRVLAARDWGKRNAAGATETDNLTFDSCAATVSASGCLPRQDYAQWTNTIAGPVNARFSLAKDLPAWPASPAFATGPVTWTRQILFLKGETPLEPAYYLFRDTVTGKQPTEWTMWTMSEKLGTPAEMAGIDQVLAVKPGNTVQPTRELPMSDRYTALGQFDVDMDYFIASPADSPRHSLRWGTRLNNGHNGVLEGLGEYQDLLHLRLPGDGVYYVAFYPRKRGTTAPAFTTLGNGTVIKVAGDFGTDYGFLTAESTTVTTEAVTFNGTSASVQVRKTEIILSLGAAGSININNLGVKSAAPVSARFSSDQVILDFPAGHPVQTVDLWTPKGLKTPAGIKYLPNQAGDGCQVTVPAGVMRVTLKME
ncbi:MAG: hypothetical protein ACYDBB_16345 [Armatimonadota bacterium]